MGFFSELIKGVKVKMQGFFGGYQTRSHPYDREAWEHDIFRATVDAIASHASKGTFQAVVYDKEGRIKKINRADPMTRLLNERPNEIMSGAEFKYRMVANLETRTTAIAYIKWERAKPVAIYPVDYTQYEFKKIVGGGIAVEFHDFEGNIRALPLECCIVMRKFYNDRLASGDGNDPVYKVLSMSKASDEGFIESVEVSNKIRGLVKQKRAMLDPQDVKKGQDEFIERFKKAAEQGGIVAVDSMEEFVPLEIKAYSANAAQMKQISDRIYTFLRTPEEIVKNSYNESQGMAWHEGKIEPIWDLFAEAVTNAYFTEHERACGNRIILAGGVMTGMSMQSITQILAQTKETGDLTTNERRELLGYPPVADGDIRQVSLNFVQDNNQNNYQGGKDDGGESSGKEQAPAQGDDVSNPGEGAE